MRIKLKDGKELDLTEEVIQKVADLIIDSGDLKPNYPYVGITKYGSVIYMEKEDATHKISCRNTDTKDRFWYKYNAAWPYCEIKPFTGSIHYVDGKPVKTVIN
jgi:hypothetical protein